MWVFLCDDLKHVFKVGFFKPDGSFYQVAIYDRQIDAEEKCSYLNGGDY